MDRRTLLAAAGAAAGAALLGGGGAVLPTRVGVADMKALSASVEYMRAVGRQTGGYVPGLAALAERGENLAKLPGKASTQVACLRVACEAWTVAGWTAFDAGRRATAWGHFEHALSLADATGDATAASQVLRYAGTMEAEAGRYNEALRLYQLAGIKLLDAPRAERRASDASLIGPTAHAYASLGRGDLARNELARAQDADLDSYGAGNLLWWQAEAFGKMGKLDSAHEFATRALESYPPGSQRDTIKAEVTIAGLHRRAGDSAADELLAGVRQRVEATASHRARWRLAAAEGTLPA